MLKLVKGSIDFFAKYFLLYLIIAIVMAVGSFFIVVGVQEKLIVTDKLESVEPLVGQGLVYANFVVVDGESTDESIGTDDITGETSFYRIYNNNITIPFVNNSDRKICSLYAYDEELLDMMDLKLLDGRLPQNGENIEVLVNEGEYHVGDIIIVGMLTKNDENETNVVEEQVLVVGIMGSIIYPLKGDSFSSELPSLSNVRQDYDSIYEDKPLVIGLRQAIVDDYPLYSPQYSTFIKYDSDYLVNNKTEIIQELQQYGYAYTYDDMYKEEVRIRNDNIKISTYVIIIDFIVAASLIIIGLYVLLNKKKQYLTVLYLSGYSYKDIMGMIIGSVGIMTLVSYQTVDKPL